MPKPGGRGGKRSKKGQKRHFTSEDEIKAQQEKEEKEKAWRKQRGIESDESEGEEDGASSRRSGATKQAAPGDLPPSSSEEEESSDDEPGKPKGVEHLIDIQNPNRTGARQTKKISELNEEGTTQLSRREREELAKQQAAARYRKLHLEGKTEEAQADMARLALIRKQRAEAATRREEEQKAKAAKEAQKKAANK